LWTLYNKVQRLNLPLLWRTDVTKGHIEGKRRLRRIICGFEQDTFDHIASKAELEGVSVSEVIRTYVEWGIESEDNG